MAKLYFYYSAMNAGKTTNLLQTEYNYRQRGMHTLLLTAAQDDRQGKGVISSRIGLDKESLVFRDQSDLFEFIQQEHLRTPIHCIFVDEAQFLKPKQVLQLTLVCDTLEIPVRAYGLRTDFTGEPFEGSKYLLAWAEELIEVKTVCRSGRKATMSARIDENGNRIFEGDQVEIGFHYEPMSRHVFNLLKSSPIEYTPIDSTEI